MTTPLPTRVRSVHTGRTGRVVARSGDLLTIALDGHAGTLWRQLPTDWIPLPPPGQAPQLRVVRPAAIEPATR